IARAVGTSIATVSMSLRDHHTISLKTRKKVRAMADQLGYQPDPRFSAMMTYLRSRKEAPFQATIAYLTDFPEREGFRKLHTHSEFFRGASERAEKLGFKIEPFWAREPGLSAERLVRLLKTRGIPGVLITSPVASSWPIQPDLSDFAVAVIGYSSWTPLYPRACDNQSHAMYLCLQKLERRGAQRIGFVFSDQDDINAEHNWLSSYLAHQHDLPASRRTRPLLGPAEKIFRKKELEEWLAGQKPDAIVGQTNPLLDILLGLGVKIPGDIAFASLDLFKRDDGLACSGIDQLSHAVGAAAMNMVASQIAFGETHNEQKNQLIYLEGQWVDGATTQFNSP
ncbi:MAG: LacI family DNA-binding transcriptional regulator, partial [Verrucomicrobia bacterium]|nr:LacI family DNA-binding transcriptional regulator [Verrucomicrobiota bacterium]